MERERELFLVDIGQIERQDVTDDALISDWVDTDESLRVLKELLLERDDDALEAFARLLVDVVGHFADVRVVQSRVDLVEYEERRRVVAADGEEKTQCCHCFLASA